MSIDKKIIGLALPSVVSNITVPLLGLVDLAIVGHLGHTEQIGAIAVGGSVFSMVYWIFAFLRMGTTGMTSQAHGAKDYRECTTVLMRALLTGLTISLLLCLLQSPILSITTLLMQPSEAVQPYFSTYYSICIWGAPAMLASYALTGWFIGMQNTRIPMIVAIVQNTLNILLSLLFVLYLDWGLKGVAAGTVLGLYGGILVSAVLALRLWRRKHLTLPSLSHVIDRRAMLRFLSVNTDIFLRTICLVCVMTFFTYAGSQQSDDILSANALLMQLFILFSYFMDGLANAAEALSGEYVGAEDTRKLNRTIRRIFLWSTGLAIIFTSIYLAGGKWFLGLLTDQPAVISTANVYMPWVCAIPLLSLMAFVWDGVFIGLTWSRGMLISMFIACITFFALYFSTIEALGNHGLWLAFLAYLFMRGLAQTLIYKRKISK